jgi:transposase InsO family protein
LVDSQRAALGRQQAVIPEKCSAALDEARVLWRRDAEAAPVRLILGRDQAGTGEPPHRDFRAVAPNEKWLTDITEFQIPAGKVYLSPLIDCFGGLVVSWTIGTRPDAELVNTMLDSAIETVANCDERPVVHSDRGALTLARMALTDARRQAHPIDVTQRVLSR